MYKATGFYNVMFVFIQKIVRSEKKVKDTLDTICNAFRDEAETIVQRLSLKTKNNIAEDRRIGGCSITKNVSKE